MPDETLSEDRARQRRSIEMRSLMPRLRPRGTGAPVLLVALVAVSAVALLKAATASATETAVRETPLEPAPASGAPVASDSGEVAPANWRWTDGFGLDLTAATWVPLSVGPEVTVELPGRILLQAHLGWMPGLYEGALSGGLQSAGVYDAKVGDLVDGAVRSATTWRLAAGWRPFEKAGLELTVGYAHVALDGSTTTRELTPLVTADIAEQLNDELGDTNIHLRSSVDNFTLAAGWRFTIAERVVVRASLGYLQAFNSDSSLEIGSRPDLAALAEPSVQSLLHEQYTRYVRIPVVGLGVGYSFF
jgi:opacity protein-like surface antigen